jgi:hypothetical protein
VIGMRRALVVAAAMSEPKLRLSCQRALARGVGNTGCTPGEERVHGALRLLTLATLRMPDLVLYAGLVDVYEDGPDGSPVPRAAVLAIGDASAGALRLTHRALEAHGQSIRYAIAAWIDRAHRHAASELNVDASHDDEVPFAVEQARLATIALTRATADDRG